MNLDYTHIIVVLDRSGSMEAMRADAIGGFNTLLEDQKLAPGKCSVSLYVFNADTTRAQYRAPIGSVHPLTPSTYVPAGGTALYDAIGYALAQEGAELAAEPEAGRPGLVILAILTDGEENASRHYKLEQIKAMLAEQQEKYGWTVLFLGVGLDAFAQAAVLGVSSSYSAPVAGKFIQESYNATSAAVTRGRKARAGGQSLESVRQELAFMPDELVAMNPPAPKVP